MLKIKDFDLLNNEDLDNVEAILKRVKHDFAKEEKEDATIYDVTLQDSKYICAYTDDEMRGIITTSIDIIRELISIEANGFTKQRFKEAIQNEEKREEIMQVLSTYNDFKTQELDEMTIKMAAYVRVGGAYLALISRPLLIDVIFGVFEVMLDDSDDEDIWFSCLYFMIRGAMKMHSSEE